MSLGYVRPARVDDASEIARIQLTTWRVAYRRLLPRHVLDQIDEDWLTQHWHEAIASPPSERHRVLVAIEQAAQWRDQGARYVVVADASSLQRSLRKGLAAMIPFAKVLRGLKKL